MGQSPIETTDESEADESEGLVASVRERRSGDDAAETANPAIGREWTDFAGANEYESDPSVSEWATRTDSVVGREWQDFAGRNEYRTDVTPSVGASPSEAAPRIDSQTLPQSGD